MKKVAIIMGSDSDFPVVSKAVLKLKEFGVPYEVHVMSAHRTPDAAAEFSKHAAARLSSRNINLSSEQSRRLENGVQQAKEKGINESLIVIDNLAFIVNVKNSTVVTAVGEDDNKTFTNIDGAVFN